ncbi:g12964 [Coccomyxa viridis]|uniref:G12964 protein n=1 Tax=Coccomyxa viridis TaxID=1274662 RepID=A0ABP1GBP3_9CHLO
MVAKSEYILFIENLSSATRSSDVKKECQYYGDIYEVERDYPSHSALVEFRRAKDAQYAWRKMEGVSIDGRRWKVDYARKEDLKFFGWKVPSDLCTPSPSRSRSPVRSTYSDDK